MLVDWALAATVLVAFIGIGVATTYRHITTSLLHPLVLVNGLFAYYVVVPGIFVLLTGRFWNRLSQSYGALSDALVLLGGAYLVILLAYHAAGDSLSNGRSPTVRGRSLREYTTALSTAIDSRVLTRLGYCGVAIGFLAYGYYVVINGGPVRLVTVTPRTAFQQIPETARWRWVALTGLFGGTAVALVGRRARAETGRLTRHDLVGITVSLVTTFLVVVSFRARQPILVLGLFVLIYVYTTGRFSDRRIVAVGGGVVLAGVLFTFVEFALLGRVSTRALLAGVVQRARLDVFMGIVAQVPSQYPYQFGSTFLGGLPFEGAGLPLSYGQQLSELFGIETEEVTLSGMLPGELYLNFGPIGVLVGAAIYGAALRAVWALREAADSPLMRGIYPVALTMVVLFWSSNALWATKAIAISLAVPVVAAILVTVLWNRIRSRFGTVSIVGSE